MRGKILFASFLLFSLPIFLNAQGFGTGIEVTVSPSSPRPQEAVTLRVQGFSFDLNRAPIRWFVNGELRKSGVGEREFSTTAPSLGSSLRVEVLAENPNGDIVSASTVIQPSEITLLWEAETYTPPFYRGKALPSHSSTIKVTAFPNFGAGTNPNTLIYTWRQDGVVLGSKSGTGKQTLILRGTRPFSDTSISVDVSNQSGSLSGRGFLTLSPKNPEIILYEEHPTLGVLLERALQGEFELPRSETTLVAYPYFFSGDVRSNPSLEYKWSLNGSETNTDASDASSITLRHTGEGGGTSSLRLTIQNAQEILQSAQRQLQISFGNQGEQSRF
ncbi:MAG: hypothetical protein WDZ90_02650 [Candidatus Paceibacterota bacterium]